MADALHSWITAVICTAAFCALAISMTPKGRVLSATKIICGVVMIFAILKPIADIDFDEYSKQLTKYNDNASELIGTAEDYNNKLNRLYIEESCEAYILDKAESFGATLDSVSVGAQWCTDGYWYPVSAEIRHELSDELMSRLSSSIEAELGIAKERQEWTHG